MRLLMLCALTVTCLLQPISAVQEAPENALIKRVAARLRQVQSSWQFVGGICTCPPLMEEQEGIAVGGWYHGTRGHLKEIAHVTVYRISSAEPASRWLEGSFTVGRPRAGGSKPTILLMKRASVPTETRHAIRSLSARDVFL